MSLKRDQQPVLIKNYLSGLHITGAFSNEDLLELEDHLLEEVEHQMRVDREENEAAERALQLIGPPSTLIADYRRKNGWLLLQEQTLLAISGLFFFLLLIPIWLQGAFGVFVASNNLGLEETASKVLTIVGLLLLQAAFLYLYRRVYIAIGGRASGFLVLLSANRKKVAVLLVAIPVVFMLRSFLLYQNSLWVDFSDIIQPWVGVFFLGLLMTVFISIIDYVNHFFRSRALLPKAINRLSFFVLGPFIGFILTLMGIILMMKTEGSLPSFLHGGILYSFMILPFLCLWILLRRKAKTERVIVS